MNEHKHRSKESTNTEEQPTKRRTKKKKLKKFTIIILIIVIILAIIVGYHVHGYISDIEYVHDQGKMLKKDIYANITGNSQHKINSAYSIGGPELLRQTLKKNLGIDPEYYAILDFTGFEKMIDELEPNGVPIDVEKDMSKNIGVSLKKGHHR